MRRSVLKYLAVVLLTATFTLGVSSRRACSSSSHDSERHSEQLVLHDAGLLVMTSVDDLRPALSNLIAENGILREELACQRQAARSSLPVAVLRARTAPVTVKAPKEDINEAVPRACLLTAEDALRFEVDAVASRTERGNILIAGSAAAIRSGVPPLTLARAPFSTELSALTAASELPTPAPRGWAVGPWGLADVHGWSVGLAGASPTLRLPWADWEVELYGTAGAGPNGPVLSLGLLVRH